MSRTSVHLRHTPAGTTALRALVTAAVAAALAVTSAACSDSGHATSSASSVSAAVTPNPAAVAAASSAVSAVHDDADVAFAQQMIVHHEGAVAMAALAADRAEDPAVRDLAARVQAAQTPEIAQMTGWLRAWGAPLTPTGGTVTDEHGGHDLDSMGMGEQDAAALEAASGAAFDTRFLQQMTVHHQGAVDMARSQQSDGDNPQAVELAGAIVTSQTAEIVEMDQLLRSLQG